MISTKKHLAPALLLSVALVAIVSSPSYAYNEYNCSDFSSQEEAQDEYDSDYGDPNYLDADDDGVACETLPSEDYYEGGDASDVYIPDYSEYSNATSTSDAPIESDMKAAPEEAEKNDSGSGGWGWLWLAAYPLLGFLGYVWEKIDEWRKG